MMSLRLSITDAIWAQLAPLLPGKLSDPGGTARDNRLFLEAVLWILRTGCPWRDLPVVFGNWNTVFARFRRWVKRGVWDRLFGSLPKPCTDGVAQIDSTIVRAHQHAAGAAGGGEQALGQSRGGFTTKVHAVVDSDGILLTCVFTPGQAADIVHAPEVLARCPKTRHVIGDRGYDCDAFVADLAARNVSVTIPARAGRLAPRTWDKEIYRQRNVIERFFARIKQLRRIATRYDKTRASYASFWHLGAIIVLLRGFKVTR